jgi:DNA end-binding protein Ku
MSSRISAASRGMSSPSPNRAHPAWTSSSQYATRPPPRSFRCGPAIRHHRYVVFTDEELKALEEAASHIIEIQAFIPDKAVDPMYYDKAYFIVPHKRGAKPYSLLQQALLESHRCALAKWAFKGKTRMVQIRATDEGLVVQQLFFAPEVRSLKDLNIEHVPVSDAELQLALKIIEQGAQENYDPTAYEDEEKQRILAAIDAKIQGQEIVSREPAEVTGGQVIDLMEALRASLKGGAQEKAPAAKAAATRSKATADEGGLATKARKPVQRAQKAPAATPKVRARK